MSELTRIPFTVRATCKNCNEFSSRYDVLIDDNHDVHEFVLPAKGEGLSLWFDDHQCPRKIEDVELPE